MAILDDPTATTIGVGASGSDPFYTYFKNIRDANGGINPGGGFGPGQGASPPPPSVGPVASGIPPAALGTTTTGASLTDQILKRLTSKEGLSAIGSALTSAGQGRAEGRAAEANYGLLRDQQTGQNTRSQQDALISAVLADLQQRRFAGDDYQRQVGNATQGGLLQGVEDAQITDLPEGVNMGTVTGGLRPSAITGRQEIGSAMQSQALQALMNPSSPAPINFGQPTGATGAGGLPQISVLDQPALSDPSAPGGFDKFLNIAGPIAAGAGTFLPGSQPPPATPANSPSTTNALTQNLLDSLTNTSLGDSKEFRTRR